MIDAYLTTVPAYVRFFHSEQEEIDKQVAEWERTFPGANVILMRWNEIGFAAFPIVLDPDKNVDEQIDVAVATWLRQNMVNPPFFGLGF